ncbi:XRE family transcriptional regulator [Aquibium microcysteis]|uniref:XRE family transcriptional regulator n=1 Tax=Aquibium microcysteis TaxID=675281 RepID=UPI00165CF229|nr:XRE family transcriptional regulator [Aquibium microcysteis]
MLGLERELRATITLSILDSIRQRGLSTEEAAAIAGVHPEDMRTLVERRDNKGFTLEALDDVLQAIDAHGPRYGG